MSNSFSAEVFYDTFRAAEINRSAHEDWCDYRATVTQFIIDCSRSGSSVTIFGAGRCDDLNLAELRKHFSFIRLVDFDKKAMQKAMNLYGISSGIEMVEYDLVGIKREWYIRFIDLFHREFVHLQSSEDCRILGRELVELMHCAYGDPEENTLTNVAPGIKGNGERTPITEAAVIEENGERTSITEAAVIEKNGEKTPAAEAAGLQENADDYSHWSAGKTDYSIILGVHSQLNNSFSGIWNYVLAAVQAAAGIPEEVRTGIKRLMADIETEQRHHTVDIVKRVNDMLLESTGDSIFMGYELYVTNNPQSPVEGAYQCSQDFEAREKKGNIKTECYIRTDWPLAAERGLIYNMVVGKFKKREN